MNLLSQFDEWPFSQSLLWASMLFLISCYYRECCNEKLCTYRCPAFNGLMFSIFLTHLTLLELSLCLAYLVKPTQVILKMFISYLFLHLIYRETKDKYIVCFQGPQGKITYVNSCNAPQSVVHNTGEGQKQAESSTKGIITRS